MEFIIVLVIICAIGSWLINKLDNMFEAVGGFFAVVGDNFYGILGLGAILFGIWIFVYYKPHPAEKHFLQYKNNKITRQQAISKISQTLYNPSRDGVPPAYQSKIMEKRLSRLRKLVKSETQFIDDLISYVKTKERLK